MHQRNGARIEVWPVQRRGDRDEEWLMLLVDRSGTPMALLTSEQLGNTLDDEEAANDLVDFCGADLLSSWRLRRERYPRDLEQWLAEWREKRIRKSGRFGELLGECESCPCQAVTSSPEGLYCENESCWPDEEEHVPESDRGYWGTDDEPEVWGGR